MNILIEDMEMPKDCPMCPMAHYDVTSTFRGCKIVTGKKYAMNDPVYASSSTRPEWCPLVEIPPLITSIPPSPILDPEWQKAHKEMGFWSPLADLYEELGIIEADEGEV